MQDFAERLELSTCQALMALGFWGLTKRLVTSTAALPVAWVRTQSWLCPLRVDMRLRDVLRTELRSTLKVR